jgi:hypothetical protein
VRRLIWTAALLVFAGGAVRAQFELFLVNGSLDQPVARAYDFGRVAAGTSISVPFQIANVSSAAATLDLLTVTGSGFSVDTANEPLLPLSLGPQQSVSFTVVFKAAGTGTFSGALNSDGIAVTLSATVPVELTYQWVTPAGVQLLSAGPVNFGSVPVGQSPTIEVSLLNSTSIPLAVPSLAVTGAGFSLLSQPAAGATVQPSASAALEIQFSPTAAGAATGAIVIGGQSFALSGTGVVPPLPQPSIAITLAAADSAQQGAITVNLSSIPQTSATGTVTLAFVPDAGIPGPADPAIAFASGGQSATFNVFIGQKQGLFGGTANSIAFQTGTTAGTLTITVELGANTAQQSITILPAVVGVAAAQGVRSTGSIEVDLTGFDNTRTAGALAFTFFGVNGNQIAPPIDANGSADFAAYFENSAGGAFELKALFPVTGDTSQVASFQVTVTNSAGKATTAITSF